MHRRARFIGHAEQQPDEAASFSALLRDGAPSRDVIRNAWYLYRRSFAVDAEVRAAELCITVDGRYELYLNETYVGRGPVRCSPAFQRYDTYDVASLLRPGDNVIAVLMHVYGVDTAWYERARDCWQRIFGDGGLWCTLEFETLSGRVALGSDDSWRALRCTAWRQDVPRSGWGQDYIEDHDARVAPTGWMRPGFDDSDWPACRQLVAHTDTLDAERGWGPVEPFPTLLRSELPRLSETPVAPSRLLARFGLRSDAALPIDRRIFEEESIRLPDGLVLDAEAMLDRSQRSAVVRTAPGCDVALLIGFGERHAGYPYIELEAEGGEIVELAVAETLPGEYSPQGPDDPPRLRRTGLLDCAHVFRYVARAGQQRFRKFEWTAVKYAMLAVRNAPRGLRIRHVGSVACHYPVQYLGDFACDDPLLTRLWETGRRTLQLCSHDAWEDCPGREKRQWLGDGSVRYLASAAAFGSSTQPLDRQYLLHGMESQRTDGLLQMYAPGDHHHNGITIPDFTLHWVCVAEDYLLHTGDAATVEQILPGIERALGWFERQLDSNGLLADLPYWHFIEWAHLDRGGESTAINAMLVGALRAAGRLAGYLERGRTARRWLGLAHRVAFALSRRSWNEARGAYVDSVDPECGAQGRRVSQQANSAMIYWEVGPVSRWQRIVATITPVERLRLTACHPVVPSGEHFDEAMDVVRANTFFGHFLYAALAKAGRFDLSLEAMRRDYGPMLATGTETLWESFRPDASLCHAFSATPVHQLSANALGVRPTAPGFREFRVLPQLGDLHEVRGRYPTPHGAVEVQWRRDAAGIAGRLVVPSATRAWLSAPPGHAVAGGERTLEPGVHSIQMPVRT